MKSKLIFKRTASLVLSLSMVASVLPRPVLAFEDREYNEIFETMFQVIKQEDNAEISVDNTTGVVVEEATESATEEVVVEEATEATTEEVVVEEATEATTEETAVEKTIQEVETFTTIQETEVHEIKTIAVNIGENKNELSFTWFSTSDNASYVQVTKGEEIDTDSEKVEANKSSDKYDSLGYYSYSAILDCFEEDAVYSYRVGNDIDGWSDAKNITIGKDDANFSFLLAGDPQIGSGSVATDQIGWENTLNLASEWFEGEIDFLVSVGDQVNASRSKYAESEYDAYFAPELLANIPSAVNTGNHEAYTYSTYSDHFTAPSNVSTSTATSVAGDQSGDYWFAYEGTLFMSLNSNDVTTASHKDFMEKAMAEYEKEYGTPTWKIVTFHHSIYSSASHYADSDILTRRETWADLFSELDIDAVLMGHDHVYTRSVMMNGMLTTENGQGEYVVDPADGEVLYLTVNSASGSKYYSIQNVELDYVAVKVQENTPNITKVDVSDNELVFTTYRTGTDNTVTDIVDTFSIIRSEETEITGTSYEAIPLEAVEGDYNGENGLSADLISRFAFGYSEEDGGLVEIVCYNEDAMMAYATSGATGEILVIPMDNPTLNGLSATGYDMKTLVGKVNNFTYGDMSSVAISPDNTKLAVAIQAESYTENGIVAIFDLDEDGNIVQNPSFVSCGVQPDALTFTPDGTMILVANEGEPREGYGEGVVDPEGSVTIITVETMTSETISFDDEAEYGDDVLIKNGATPSQDFEPEFIASTNDTAYVALQENNAIAVLDLNTKTFTGVYGLGMQDHSVIPVDIANTDDAPAISMETYEGLYGIRMPDGISIYEIDGTTYLFTANEGDGREWGEGDNEYVNEAKSRTSPTGNIVLDDLDPEPKKVAWFDPTDYDMLSKDVDYLFGARSFSIFAVSGEGLDLVYDSGAEFSEIVAELYPDYFNCSNDDITVDDRSDNKGIEPEYTIVGEAFDKVYAFTGLERQGGIMIYDVTDPSNAKFVNYLNSRDYSENIAGDVAPEGLAFVNASDSATGNPSLLVANEVSGTMSVIELTEETVSGGSSNDGSSSGGSSSSSSSSSSNSSSSSSSDDDDTTADTTTDTTTETTQTTTDTTSTTAEKFSDISASDWHYEAVNYAYENGLFSGVSENSFEPDSSMTRAMLVTVLHRLAGETSVDGSVNFTDIADGQWYSNAVLWASNTGIVNGVTDNSFAPDNNITREEIAVILYRYAVSTGMETQTTGDLTSFSDASSVSDWASEAMIWATSVGIITGRDNSQLAPTGVATRAEVATMLLRYISL